MLVSLLCVAAPAHSEPTDSPNIVLILADDLGIGDCGAYNPDSRIPTPNLDRLADEGVRFTDAHSPSAVCTPTRYGVLTGEYAWRTRLKHGVLGGYSRSLIDDRTTIGELCRRHGYTTACVGKWHLGLGVYDGSAPHVRVDYDEPIDAGPHTEGFEYSFIIPASLDMAPYVYIENGALVARPTEHVEGSASRRKGGKGFWRAGPIAPGFEFDQVLPTVVDRATKWLETAASGDRPFFLYLPLPAPHTPWVPTEEFHGRTEVGPYGDFVAQVDAVVGAVRETLSRTGALEKTLLIVTSDNGAHWLPTDIEQYSHRSNARLRGQKADIHEGGHRIPMIVRWPGHAPAGLKSDALIGLQDLFATLGELLGADEAELAGATDSVSFLTAIRTGKGARRTLVHHSFDGMFAVRREHWKLIDGLGSGGFTKPKRVEGADPAAGQLYDLREDPGEQHDLYDVHPEVVAELERTLNETRAAGSGDAMEPVGSLVPGS
jgi:arylsulfatase A-like enzyme